MLHFFPYVFGSAKLRSFKSAAKRDWPLPPIFPISNFRHHYAIIIFVPLALPIFAPSISFFDAHVSIQQRRICFDARWTLARRKRARPTSITATREPDSTMILYQHRKRADGACMHPAFSTISAQYILASGAPPAFDRAFCRHRIAAITLVMMPKRESPEISLRAYLIESAEASSDIIESRRC